MINLQASMESGFDTGKGADGCMVYQNQYPLEAGNPYRNLQMEMYHAPYINPYGCGWRCPYCGMAPSFFTEPCWDGRTYSWSTATNSGKCGEGLLKC